MSAPVSPTRLPPMNDGSDTPGPAKSHEETLRESFAMIDADNSGTITAGEFGKLLRLQGEDVTDADAATIIAQIDLDGDTTNLTFDEFEHIMSDIQHMHDDAKPGCKFSLAQAFVAQTKHRSGAFQDKDPLYLRMQKAALAENGNVGLSNSMNARMQVASFIDGNVSQVVVLCLVVVDVVCVLMELMIVFTECPCTPGGGAYGYGYGSSYGSSYSSSYSASSYSSSSYSSSSYGSSYGDSSYSAYGRKLGDFEDADVSELTWTEWLEKSAFVYDIKVGSQRQELLRRLAGGECPKEGRLFSEQQHNWEVVLNILSVSILAIFAMQIGMLMFLYGKEFLKNWFYMLDFVVVFGALLLETSHWHQWFIVQGGGLFALLLFWRIVRVVHGLATSIEMHHATSDAKITHDRNKMHELIVVSRRKGAAQKMFFSEYHVSLTDTGVEAAGIDADKEHHRIQLMKEGESLGESKHETKRMLDVERIRRQKAEMMYMDAYSFFHEHIEGLQDHVIAIGTSHGDGH